MLILLFTVIGFFMGLGYVIVKRKIRIEGIAGIILAALTSAAVYKFFRDYFRKNLYS